MRVWCGDKAAYQCTDEEKRALFDECKKAAEIADEAFYQILNVIDEGMTEKEIAAHIDYFMALKGSEKTIKLYKPRLIVSLYHRTEDLIKLPLLIKELNPEYRFYLRHHPYIPAWDTLFYCV